MEKATAHREPVRPVGWMLPCPKACVTGRLRYDYELSYTRGIDMRRIKIPDDLITKYAEEYISYFYNEIQDIEEDIDE